MPSTPSEPREEDQHIGIAGLPPEDTTTGSAPAPAVTPPSPNVAVDAATPVQTPLFDDRRAKPSRKKWALIGGGVALALALIGGGVYAYSQYQKPENVVLDSVVKAMTSNAVQAKMTIKSPYRFETTGYKITLNQLVLDMRGSRDPRSDYAAALELTINDKPLKLVGRSLIDSNGDVYFRFDDLDRSVRQLYEVMGEKEAPQPVIEALAPLQNKWVRYSIEDSRKSNESGAKTTTCIMDNYKKHQKNDALTKELKKKYEAHQFVRTIDNGKSRDGLSDYEVSIDQDVLKAFIADMETTQFAKDIKECMKPGSQDTPINDRYIEQISGGISLQPLRSSPGFSTKTHLFIDSWTHTLRRIETDTAIKNGTISTTITTSTELAYDKVEVKTPADSVTLTEWLKGFDALGSVMNSSQPASVGKIQKTATAKAAAEEVAAAANDYRSFNRGVLPMNADALRRYISAKRELGTSKIIATPPVDESAVQYVYCSATEAYVVYADAFAGRLAAYGLGTGEDTSSFNASSACRGKMV